MRIILFGASGNLGSCLLATLRDHGHEVLTPGRELLAALDFRDAAEHIASSQPDIVINAVAWNDVDGAERVENRAACFRLNVDLPRVLSDAAATAGARFVHFSSDYVFSGDSAGGYAEADEPKPVSEYGRSRWAGEQAALAANSRTLVIRTSRLFGPRAPSPNAKPSFVDMMVAAARTRPSVMAVQAETACPTYTMDLAEATVDSIDHDGDTGVLHLVSSGPAVTWHDFAREIWEAAELDVPLVAVPPEAFARIARRPANSELVNTRGPQLPSRISALRRHFEQGK